MTDDDAVPLRPFREIDALPLRLNDLRSRVALLAVVLIALVGLPVPLGEGAAVTVGGSAGVALWPADHADPRFVSRNK